MRGLGSSDQGPVKGLNPPKYTMSRRSAEEDAQRLDVWKRRRWDVV